MKKTLLTMAAALALVGCSNDDLMTGVENNAQNNGAIGVNTFIANGTRGVAYNDVVEFREANGNFDLYAWEKLADDAGYKTPAFMDGVAFVMGTDQPSTWYYEDKGEVRFWQELQDGSTVDFYAVSPKDVEATIEAETQTIEYTVADNSAEQVDLMYARTTEVEPNEDVKKNGVHLDFNHALSQIVFKAKTREDYVDYVSAEIKEVRVVNVANSGTFTFSEASYPAQGDYNDTAKQPWSNVAGTAEYTAQIGWDATAEENSVMTVNTGLNGDETVLTNSQSALILMPQETTAAEVYDRYTPPTEGAYFAVTCQVVYHRPTTDADGNETTTPVYIVGENSEDENVKYKTLYFPLETTWNAGYKYTYTFVFSADVADPITINEDLYVGPWGDGGNTDVEVDESEKVGEDALTQAQLNARLIANQFASANAASITADGVTFINNESWPTTENEVDHSMYFSYENLNINGLLDTPIADENGEYWRVPTADEWNMLVITDEVFKQVYGENNPMWSDNMSTQESTETVNIDGQETTTTLTIGPAFAVDAISRLAKEDWSIGALRFKGTKQHAAYLYSPVTLGSGIYALEIRIKALKSDEEVEFGDIFVVDNWNDEDCIKIVLPALNYSNGSGFESFYMNDKSAWYLTSTSTEVQGLGTTPKVHYFNSIDGLFGKLQASSYSLNTYHSVRLIKCDADGNLVLE